jgi:hypothetical protein
VKNIRLNNRRSNDSVATAILVDCTDSHHTNMHMLHVTNYVTVLYLKPAVNHRSGFRREGPPAVNRKTGYRREDLLKPLLLQVTFFTSITNTSYTDNMTHWSPHLKECTSQAPTLRRARHRLSTLQAEHVTGWNTMCRTKSQHHFRDWSRQQAMHMLVHRGNQLIFDMFDAKITHCFN